jgi:hypothetical protein
MLASKHVGGAFVNHPNLFLCCKEGIENGNIGKQMRGTERHQLGREATISKHGSGKRNFCAFGCSLHKLLRFLGGFERL